MEMGSWGRLARDRALVAPVSCPVVGDANSMRQEFFISGFSTILPAIHESDSLHMPKGSGTVWPTSALSLAASALLLPLGRAADLIPRNGLRLVFLWGLVLFSAASLAASLAPTFVPFVVARAFQGCGAAAFLPTGIALLGLHYRPGPRKNKVFAAYGATAPVGFWSGLAVGGWAGERALADAAREAKGISVTHTGYADWLAEGWRIYFYLGTAASIVSTVVAFLTVPTDAVSSDAVSGVGAEDGGQADDDAGSSSSGDNTVKKGKMDWLGTGTLVPALLLLVYGVTDGPNAPAGWRTWYIALALSAGVVLLVLGVYVEGWVAEQPLIPFDVFRVRHMTSLILGLFLIYGVFGIYLFYANF